MPTTMAMGASAARRQGIGPYLIKHGSDCVSAAWHTSHTSTVANMPADGFVFATALDVFAPTAVSLATCQADMSGMATAKPSFGACNRYFPRIVLTSTAPNWWTDAHWTTISQNMADFAQAALAEGCHGIIFDNEWYGSGQGPWDWGSTGYQQGSMPSAPGGFGDSGNIDPTSSPTVGADVGHTLQQSRDKVQARGKQVMDAVLGQWPGCRIMFLHGACESSTLSAAALGANAVDASWANELLGSFQGGVAQSIAANGSGMLIDGGEYYTLRTLTDFQRGNQWRQHGFKNSATTVFDSAAKAVYRPINAWGIEELDISTGGFPQQTAAQFQSEITNAMRCSSYVWTYTETYDYWGSGWPLGGAPPQAWLDAFTNGRAAGRL